MYSTIHKIKNKYHFFDLLKYKTPPVESRPLVKSIFHAVKISKRKVIANARYNSKTCSTLPISESIQLIELMVRLWLKTS